MFSILWCIGWVLTAWVGLRKAWPVLVHGIFKDEDGMDSEDWQVALKILLYLGCTIAVFFFGFFLWPLVASAMALSVLAPTLRRLARLD